MAKRYETDDDLPPTVYKKHFAKFLDTSERAVEPLDRAGRLLPRLDLRWWSSESPLRRRR